MYVNIKISHFLLFFKCIMKIRIVAKKSKFLMFVNLQRKQFRHRSQKRICLGRCKLL